jgi:hypothetical protein
MAERKDRMALLSRYSKLHTARYEQKPSLNLNVEQWASDALIESYGISKCYDLLNITLVWHKNLVGIILHIMQKKFLMVRL